MCCVFWLGQFSGVEVFSLITCHFIYNQALKTVAAYQAALIKHVLEQCICFHRLKSIHLESTAFIQNAYSGDKKIYPISNEKIASERYKFKSKYVCCYSVPLYILNWFGYQYVRWRVRFFQCKRGNLALLDTGAREGKLNHLAHQYNERRNMKLYSQD